jgi:hypothetical protein
MVRWFIPKFPKSETELFEKLSLLKGQSHEKVGELRVWGIGLGPG